MGRVDREGAGRGDADAVELADGEDGSRHVILH
jgi:hypothetical protein